MSLLGGFGLSIEGAEVILPPGPQRLLAFVALHPRRLRREVVAGALWPDNAPARAAACLRSTLWRLRAAGIDVSDGGWLLLDASIEVDVHRLAATVARLRDPDAVCRPDDLDPAMLSGELLPDWHLDEWASVERERLRQLRLHGLEALAMRLLRLGRHGEAVEVGLMAVRDEPLRESAHRVVVHAHRAEGNPAEALRQYEWCARLLRVELGVAPSPALAQLVADL